MASNPPPDAAHTAAGDAEVDFYYIKSKFFRVIHIDGGYGGITARGYIHIAVYNERRAIPRVTTARIKDGVPTPETVKESKEGVVRELEADLLMDEQTALELAHWLQNRVQQLRQFKPQIEKGDNGR